MDISRQYNPRWGWTMPNGDKISPEIEFVSFNMSADIPLVNPSPRPMVVEESRILFEDHHHAFTQMHEIHEMKEDQEFSDVTLVVGPDCYHAHKLILASASSVLKERFKENPSEKRIILQRVSGSVIKPLIDFAYNGQVEITRENKWDLFLGADALQILPVRRKCYDLIQHSMTPESCLNVFQSACQYHIPDLKDQAKRYCLKHIQHIVQNKLKDLCRLSQDDMLSLMAYEFIPGGLILPLERDESQLCDALYSYIEYKRGNMDEDFLLHACKHLRPENISQHMLCKFRNLLVRIAAPEKCFDYIERQVLAPGLYTEANNEILVTEGLGLATDDYFKTLTERFNDHHQNPSTYVTGVDIHKRTWHKRHIVIVGLKMHYSDGTSQMYGSQTSDHIAIMLQQKERIIRVKARAGYLIDQLTFITNLRTLGPHGGEGGYQVVEDSPPVHNGEGSEVKGWLYGLRGGLVETDGGQSIARVHFKWAYRREQVRY